LKNEFKEADKDNNKLLTREEFIEFFYERSSAKTPLDRQTYAIIVEKIFEQMDVDQDGTVDVEEFVTVFFGKQR